MPAARAADCYLAVLSAPAVQALQAVEPAQYVAVQAGDVVLTASCAVAQIQDLADEIRTLEGHP